jgi:hypothetical protein
MTGPDYFDPTHYAALRSALGFGEAVHARAVTGRTPEEHEEAILAKQLAMDLARKLGRFAETWEETHDATGIKTTPQQARANVLRAMRESR